MAKQKAGKPKTAAIDDRLLAEIKSEGGGGQSDDIIDWAFWLSDDDSNIAPPPDAGPRPAKKPKAKKYAVNLPAGDWPWVQALDRLDRLGDEGLLNALRESCDPSSKIKKYSTDLDERRAARKRAKKGRGRRRLPAYTLSRNDALLLIADECVKGYIQRGKSVKVALDKVRDEWARVPINGSTLAAVHNGEHASLNRHRKRL
jgi:hypothetical protein